MRLDRWLVTIGTGSRSQVQKTIRSGKVMVNNQIVRDPGQNVDEKKDALMIGGEQIDGRLMRHVMLYKPAGILTAARDKKQPTVMDLLPSVFLSIGCMPVGRLDKDTTGLLLLTCDGELNHRLLSPSRHVDKVYRATVDGPLTENEVHSFASGIRLNDFDAAPAGLVIEESSAYAATALVTIHEGKFHQVKRMFEVVDRTVTKLHRLSFGPLQLTNLQPGQWRELTTDEVRQLYASAQMEEPS